MTKRNLVTSGLVLGCAASIALTAASMTGRIGIAGEPSGPERKIRAALADATTLEFIETPLRDVVDYLKDLHGIEIQIDTKAMDGVGVSADTPITRNLKGVSLRSALNLIMRDLDLTFVVRDEVLQITTPGAVACDVSVKTHAAADIMMDEAGSAALITAVEMTLDRPADAPPRAQPGPVPPRVTVVRGVLVVRGSLPEHERIAELLSQLRQELKLPLPMPAAGPDDPRAKKQAARAERAPADADPFGDSGPARTKRPADPPADRDPFGP